LGIPLYASSFQAWCCSTNFFRVLVVLNSLFSSNSLTKALASSKNFFLYQTIHRSIGFDKNAVHRLTLASNHTFGNAHFQDFFKQTQKHFFAIQTSGSANGTMPW
jgi:hypothetical protein